MLLRQRNEYSAHQQGCDQRIQEEPSETMDAGDSVIARKHISTPQATSCHHERAAKDTDAEKSVIVTQGT